MSAAVAQGVCASLFQHCRGESHGLHIPCDLLIGDSRNTHTILPKELILQMHCKQCLPSGLCMGLDSKLARVDDKHAKHLICLLLACLLWENPFKYFAYFEEDWYLLFSSFCIQDSSYHILSSGCFVTVTWEGLTEGL